MSSKPQAIIGDIPSVAEGTVFADRYTLYQAGVHRHNQAGIVGTASTGAESIVLSGGYVDDSDNWLEIVYTGEGGNDIKRKVQYADQQLIRGNQALAKSAERRQPVRVIRGARHPSPYSPPDGYRYDGLYTITEYWSESGKDGFLIWRFRMHKMRATPAPNTIADIARKTRGAARRSSVTVAPHSEPRQSAFTYALDILPTCPHCTAPARAQARFCHQCGGQLQTSQFTLRIGQLLNRGEFTIVRPLSYGGMGAIYLAHDNRTFQRDVVIKSMLDYFDATNPAEVQSAHERFVNEARTLAQLRHPAIPTIMSHFEDDGRNYIVMEYIEGANLEQQLSRQRGGQAVLGAAYPRGRVQRWARELSEVLEYLASRNPVVVHHDIKPANLILDARKAIRLVDFGTARTRLVAQQHTVGVQRSSIFGTAGYAPPEQYRGQSEPRSDVYALAATLYHLATDDDPSAHPFEFPQLEALGAFGVILRDALHAEVTQRPTAADLHQRLISLEATPSP